MEWKKHYVQLLRDEKSGSETENTTYLYGMLLH